MIEKTVLDFLRSELSDLNIPVWMEIPEGETLPDNYVLLEKTGSRSGDHIRTSTLAVQSYAKRMVDAANLNETVKSIMDRLPELREVGRSELNSDYNFTDREKRIYRYQAVYDVTHY